MQNLYDRAVFATELNMRDKIFLNIHAGRAPAHAFGIPNEWGNTQDSNNPPTHPRPIALSSADETSFTSADPNAKKEIDISKLDGGWWGGGPNLYPSYSY